MNVTLESLREKHGDKAESVFREIADKGGYGNVPTNYVGGLDIFSVIDPTNETISDQVKNDIAKLAGVSRKDADTMVETGKVIFNEQTSVQKAA
jgi:hypothetical protein